MHLYRAEIYYALNETATLEAASNGIPLDEASLAANKEVAVASFKKVLEDPKKAWVGDALSFINLRVDFIFNQGIIAYNAKKYEAAADAFLAATEMKTYIG